MIYFESNNTKIQAQITHRKLQHVPLLPFSALFCCVSSFPSFFPFFKCIWVVDIQKRCSLGCERCDIEDNKRLIISTMASMRSGKSQIKSKKAKLLEKKGQKGKLASRVIELSSQQELLEDEKIEKRRAKPAKQSDLPAKFNNINIDKLKRVEYEPNRALLDQKALLIEETNHDHPMQHSDARALFSYRIEGQETSKYVSDLYLEQRIKKIAEEEQNRLNAQAEEEKKESAEKEEEEKEERKRASRYFQSLEEEDNQNRLVKCFRCGKKGHIAKNCLEEKLQAKCTFCLGEHHHHDCNSRSCFRCNELGHIASECRATGLQCKKCGKKGHIEKNCGAIIYLDYSRIKSDYEFREKYSGNDLKKLRCMAGCADPHGHFNCHKYHNFHKSLPFESAIRYNDQPDRVSNEAKQRFFDYQRKLQNDRPAHSSHKSKKHSHSHSQPQPQHNPYNAYNNSYQIAYSNPYHNNSQNYYNEYAQPYRFQRSQRHERW